MFDSKQFDKRAPFAPEPPKVGVKNPEARSRGLIETEAYGRKNTGMFFSFSFGEVDVNAIAGFDSCLARVKTPLRNVFVTSGYLHVRRDNRIETDLLDAIRGEINTRAVLCLVCVAG